MNYASFSAIIFVLNSTFFLAVFTQKKFPTPKHQEPLFQGSILSDKIQQFSEN